MSWLDMYFFKQEHWRRTHTDTLIKHASRLTTFLLPSGHYRHLIAPKGLKTPQKAWTKVKDTIIKGFRWATHNGDETLIHTPDYQTLENHLQFTLMRCDNINLKVSAKDVNKGKCIRFAGRILTSNGAETTTEDNQAIREFPQPTTRAELRGFIQLTENLASKAPFFKCNIETLRALMNSKQTFEWKRAHTTEFHKVKKMLTSETVVQQFSKKKKQYSSQGPAGCTV